VPCRGVVSVGGCKEERGKGKMEKWEEGGELQMLVDSAETRPSPRVRRENTGRAVVGRCILNVRVGGWFNGLIRGYVDRGTGRGRRGIVRIYTFPQNISCKRGIYFPLGEIKLFFSNWWCTEDWCELTYNGSNLPE